jgi:hypothetical protein
VRVLPPQFADRRKEAPSAFIPARTRRIPHSRCISLRHRPIVTRRVLCKHFVPRASNGANRGLCKRPSHHHGLHGWTCTCFSCGCPLNKQTAAASTLDIASGRCKKCTSIYNHAYRKPVVGGHGLVARRVNHSRFHVRKFKLLDGSIRKPRPSPSCLFCIREKLGR